MMSQRNAASCSLSHSAPVRMEEFSVDSFKTAASGVHDSAVIRALFQRHGYGDGWPGFTREAKRECILAVRIVKPSEHTLPGTLRGVHLVAAGGSEKPISVPSGARTY